MNTPQFDINRFRDAVKGTGGVLVEIARRYGVSRKTLWQWRKERPELLEIIAEEREEMIDRAESKLLEIIGEGDVSAIKYYLSTQGKERGYTTRTEQKIEGEVEHSGGVTIYLPDNGR